MTKAADTIHRVIHLPPSLRKAIQTTRDVNEQTNEQFVAAAVEKYLPLVVDGLQELGFNGSTGKTVPVRLPFAYAAGTLATLKDASEQIGLPVVQLLSVCLSAATSESVDPTKRRRRTTRKKNQPKARRKVSKTRKRPS
ncbi:MAG: hypothetical protein MI861_19280 [Pirellulales bacterium]|nr:hypothetical protein [Pirellulales bacterium]